MNKKHALAAVMIILLFAFLLAFNSIYSGSHDMLNLAGYTDTSTVSLYISRFGTEAIIISILLNIIISVLGVIPSIFLTGANILVFGVYKGFAISWAGEVVGAVVSFLLYRWGIKTVAGVHTEKWMLFRTLDSFTVARQIYILALVRLSPFVPSGIINLFSAMSSVPLLYFIIATAIGKLPSLIIEASFSYNLLNVSKNYINLTISVFAAILIYMAAKREYLRLNKYRSNTGSLDDILG